PIPALCKKHFFRELLFGQRPAVFQIPGKDIWRDRLHSGQGRPRPCGLEYAVLLAYWIFKGIQIYGDKIEKIISSTEAIENILKPYFLRNDRSIICCAREHWLPLQSVV